MTNFLRSTLAAVLAVFCLTVTAHAQAAVPGDPNGAGFPAIGVPGQPVDNIDQAPEDLHTQWSEVASLPEPKIYNMVTSLDGKIYSFGGYSLTSGQLVLDNSSYMYDPAADTWTQIADFPSSAYIRGHALAVGGKIYIMGGSQYNSSTGDYSGVELVYEYDPSSDSYNLKSSMPSTQFFCAAGVIDDMIYLIGGRSATSYLTTVQSYDPATDTWDVATNFPRPVMYIGSATVDNKIVLTGGYNTNFSPSRYIADTYVAEMDGGALKFTQVADYPIGPIIYPCGTGLGTMAYFSGGRPAAFGNAAATDWTFSYDVATDKWMTVEKKITGFQNSHIAAADGKIYAPGGEGASGIISTGAVEMFDPSADAPHEVKTDMNTVVTTTKSSDRMEATVLVTLYNTGTVDVNWSTAVEGSAAWLTDGGDGNGTLSAYESAQIIVTVDGNVLTDPRVDGIINITTDVPGLETIPINVSAFLVDEDIYTERTVLVEEFSGTWCGYCPDGVDSLKALEAQFGDKVAVVTYHYGQHDPMMNATGLEIIRYLEVTGYPTASVDRQRWNGASEIPISRTIWGAAVRASLELFPAPVSLEIKNKTYDPQSKKVTFTADVTFHSAAAGDHRLMFVQTTNQRNFAQVDYTPNSRLVYPYFHDHVADLILPDAEGYQLGDGNIIEPGTKFTQDFSFTSIDSVSSLSDFTIFVYKRDRTVSSEVLQSHFEPLLDNLVSVQDPMVAGTFDLEQNFPNPFNPSTTIRYNVPHTAQVKLVVTDVLGREVTTLVNDVKTEGLHTVVFDAKGLQSGTYFLTMTSGSFIKTHSMTLMK